MSARTCLLALLFAATAAWTPTPASPMRLHSVRVSSAIVSRSSVYPSCALPGADFVRRQGSVQAPAALLLRVARLSSPALKILFSTLCSVFAFTMRALAADRVKSRVAAASSTYFVLNADVLKWGGLCALFTLAYVFREPETPILVETPQDVPAVANESTPEPTALIDDADVMSDLRKRMMELAAERDAADNQDDSLKPPASSEQGWGTGSTAVLEPPQPDETTKPPSSLFQDKPAVNFPVGFPLRDAEVPSPANAEPPEAVATEEQIAMLERMFGIRGDH